MKVGRNHPCPCGSGRKYKVCCMNADKVRATGASKAAGIAWLRMRRTEGKLVQMLGDHALEHYGQGALAEAWDEFTLWEDVVLDPDDPPLEFETAFVIWWTFHWVPDNAEVEEPDHWPEMPVAGHYLEHHAERLDSFAKRFIEEACSQPFSFFMVRDVRPGARMTIRDLLTKREFDVHERRASKTLQRGSIIFTSVVSLDGESIMLGCAPCAIPPSYAGVFFDLREELADEDAKGFELLREWDFELREIYFDIRADIFDPQLPEMQNTDGDPLQPTKLFYELADSHWAGWLDTSLPALKDQTPREAAKTETGRERLEAVLWQFEQHRTASPHEPDVDMLRKRLGMD